MLSAALGFGGKLIDTFVGLGNAAADRKAQMNAAKKGVQWRVADANKAGINPLAALGMNPINMSPVSVGTDFGGMGADLGRAMDAGSTKAQQADLMTSRLLDAQITGAELDNDIKRAELASFVRRTAGAPGATSVPGISVNGPKRTVDHPLYGSVTRDGMAAGDLTEEIGELGDWMEGANYANEWVGANTGMPIVSSGDIEMLRAVRDYFRDPYVPTALGPWYIKGAGRR